MNRRKNGEIFNNLVHMSPIRVGNHTYICGIQADVTDVDADLRKQDHLDELKKVVDSIFAANINAWASLQISNFDPACTVQAAVPYAEMQLVLSYSSAVYDEAKRRFVALAPSRAGDSTRLKYVNTFLHVDKEEKTGNWPSSLVRSTSEPALDATSEDLERLPAEMLRDSLRQLQLGRETKTDREEADVEPAPSRGSQLHPDGCTPCSFHCYSLLGCNRGELCKYCHGEHPRRGRRRGKRGGKGGEAKTQPEAGAQESVTIESSSSKAGVKKALALPTPTALEPLLSALELLSPLPLISSELLAQAQVTHMATGAGLASTSRVDGFSSHFCYSESTIILEIRQRKQVVPFVRRRPGPRKFSVEPALPDGLALHRCNGIISGVAWQLTPPEGSLHVVRMETSQGVDFTELRVSIVEAGQCDDYLDSSSEGPPGTDIRTDTEEEE